MPGDRAKQTVKQTECWGCKQVVKVRRTGFMVEHKTSEGKFCPGSAMRPR